MSDLIAQDWAIAAILSLMALEWVILSLLYLSRRTRLGPLAAAANLMAGGGLLLAVRAGLTDQTLMVWMWLALAGLGHGIDLTIRLRDR